MTVENAIELVQDDTQRGFGPSFEAVSDEEGDGFEVARHFRDMDVVSNDEVASVVWTYRCRQVDWFGTIPPSGATLTIKGTTTVDTRGKEPMFHRYIDWLSVYGALGYTLYQRQLVDEADWQVINNPPAP